ncbi:MAG: TraB/GumN family protein [Bacteroidetes bacterium]|nr:MAG: TraB/GumN family protein [Bacteroidota bacterium]
MKKSLLWQLTPRSGGPSSFLFGTMHVRDLRAFEWFELAKVYLEKCPVFATEFEFSETDHQAVAAVMQPADQLPLDQALKAGVWKNMQFYCKKKLGVPAENLRHLHPMAVSLALTNALLAGEAAYSLDETLWEYARSKGKRTAGVETFEEQLQTLKRIPYKQHLKSLTWLLKNYGRQKKRLKKMMRWYRSGNIQRLYQSARKDARGMRRAMLFDRNRLMVQRFTEIARQESLFCAVGAGHLAGEKGMLRLLRKNGFKVKAIPGPKHRK